jgi:hypothetical protein
MLFASGEWMKYSVRNYIQMYGIWRNRWFVVQEIDTTGQRAFHGTVAVPFNIYYIGECEGED